MKNHTEDVYKMTEELPKRALSTEILHFDNGFDQFGAVSTPLYQTATFKQVLDAANECRLLRN